MSAAAEAGVLASAIAEALASVPAGKGAAAAKPGDAKVEAVEPAADGLQHCPLRLQVRPQQRRQRHQLLKAPTHSRSALARARWRCCHCASCARGGGRRLCCFRWPRLG